LKRLLSGYNFGIMLKRLAILAAISAFMAVCASGQPNKTSGDKDMPPGNHPPATGSIDSHDNYTHPEQIPQKSSDEAFSWHTAIKRPEWWAIGLPRNHDANFLAE
jgi:hypothetical protein